MREARFYIDGEYATYSEVREIVASYAAQQFSPEDIIDVIVGELAQEGYSDLGGLAVEVLDAGEWDARHNIVQSILQPIDGCRADMARKALRERLAKASASALQAQVSA